MVETAIFSIFHRAPPLPPPAETAVPPVAAEPAQAAGPATVEEQLAPAITEPAPPAPEHHAASPAAASPEPLPDEPFLVELPTDLSPSAEPPAATTETAEPALEATGPLPLEDVTAYAIEPEIGAVPVLPPDTDPALPAAGVQPEPLHTEAEAADATELEAAATPLLPPEIERAPEPPLAAWVEPEPDPLEPLHAEAEATHATAPEATAAPLLPPDIDPTPELAPDQSPSEPPLATWVEPAEPLHVADEAADAIEPQTAAAPVLPPDIDPTPEPVQEPLPSEPPLATWVEPEPAEPLPVEGEAVYAIEPEIGAVPILPPEFAAPEPAHDHPASEPSLAAWVEPEPETAEPLPAQDEAAYAIEPEIGAVPILPPAIDPAPQPAYAPQPAADAPWHGPAEIRHVVLEADQLGLANPVVITLLARLGGSPAITLDASNTGIYRPHGTDAAAPWHGDLTLDPAAAGRTGIAAGTRILTARGELEVERLLPGDTALTLRSPALLPIAWIGRSTATAAPILIEAGALGPDLPRRDVCLAAEQAVYVDPVPVAANRLVNGTTIRALDSAAVDLFHVDVGRAEILLAEGLPLSSGGRSGMQVAS